MMLFLTSHQFAVLALTQTCRIEYLGLVLESHPVYKTAWRQIARVNEEGTNNYCTQLAQGLATVLAPADHFGLHFCVTVDYSCSFQIIFQAWELGM